MKRIDDEYILTTGKRIYPNRGIIGLTEVGGEFKIYEGYDGTWLTEGEVNQNNAYSEDDIELTNAEVEEIATYMSWRWLKLAHNLKTIK